MNATEAKPQEMPPEVRAVLDAALQRIQPVVAPLVKEITEEIAALDQADAQLEVDQAEIATRANQLQARRAQVKKRVEGLQTMVFEYLLKHLKPTVDTLEASRHAPTKTQALWVGIKDVLASAKRPLSVREIDAELRARGWSLSKRTGLQIVRNTLARKTKLFGRCGGGTYTLLERMATADGDPYVGGLSAGDAQEGGGPIAAAPPENN